MGNPMTNPKNHEMGIICIIGIMGIIGIMALWSYGQIMKWANYGHLVKIVCIGAN